MSIIPKDWLEEGNGEVLPFMQLMFVVGKALEIHPWNMQDAIEKAEHKISPQVKIVRLGELRGSYETARANRADLPSFADVLEKGDVKASLRALGDTMSYCIQCHATFRQ